VTSRRVSLPLLVFSFLAGAGAQTPSPLETPILGLDGKPDPLPDAGFVETVKKSCSTCHVVPQPQYLPRAMWRVRIEEMAQHSVLGTGVPADTTGDAAQWLVDLGRFVRYFEARAPQTLPLPEPWPQGDGGLRLSRQQWRLPEDRKPPVVANVRLLDLDADGKPEIVACDMGQGRVMLGEPQRKPGELRIVASIPHPDHSEMVDLDRDGRRDLLVADLGDFLPGDHTKGSIVWLRQTAPLQFEKVVLIEGIPRTADVEAADFDQDGDLDLVVAAFGWHTVGGISVYTNKTTDWKRPRFEGQVADPRPGAIHVPPVDLNGDGRMDFVGLVSQQYEHVSAYINLGPGKGFRQETLFRAVVPMWGSSGIQLADLDGDGDLDLLMTNGDSLDDFTIRPYHGVRWFENEGSFPWKQHDLASMPGAHRAQAADLDGDGDLDVVATAFLPDAQHPSFHLLERQGNLATLTALGWIEQVEPRRFVPHPLELGKLTHTTLDLGDVDLDGDVDIVTGNFAGTFAQTEALFTADSAVDVWINQAKPASGPPKAGGQPTPPPAFGLPLSGREAEEFLRTARVVERKPIGTGVTRPDRLTLSDGRSTHRALFKMINEHKLGMQRLEAGGFEFDFRDSWKSEVAAYELDKLLELGLVPPTVERVIGGRTGSLQLWVEGAMTEDERKKRGLEAPDAAAWNAQMHRVRLLHQLTYNTDFRNVRNVLVDPAFRLYAVDSSRAFRIQPELMTPGDLVRFSRALLERLAALDRATIEAGAGRWLEKMQIDGLLTRRDKILALVRQRVAEAGEEATFDP